MINNDGYSFNKCIICDIIFQKSVLGEGEYTCSRRCSNALDRIRDIYLTQSIKPHPDILKRRENHRKYMRRATHVREARRRILPSNLTMDQEIFISSFFRERCALSGSMEGIHLDHVLPLSIGHGGTTLGNIIPLRSDLNISKGARNIFDWFADNRERFGLEQRKFDELIEYLADINDMTTKEYEEYVRWCHDNPRTIDEIKADKDIDGASA